MTKHTPGPWINKHWNSNGHIEITADAWQSDGPLERMVRLYARYSEADGFTSESISEAHANAQLIAAAPDLLAACQAVMQSVIRVSGPESPVSWPSPATYYAIKAAIALASGTDAAKLATGETAKQEKQPLMRS
jgi:hypothetical protein